MGISMTIAILQARMSSNRLPGKVLQEINGKPMIYWQLQRILKATMIEKVIVATSLDSTDDQLVEFLSSQDITCIRGSLDNVKERFDTVLSQIPSETFIRLTGDCPLVMPHLIDEMVREFGDANVDYFSNTIQPTFPDGLDIEVVKTDAFKKLSSFSLSRAEKEHVTYGLYSRPGEFNIRNFSNAENLSHMRWTVDYQEDLDFVREIFLHFKGREDLFGFSELLDFLTLNPGIKSMIDANRRNESLFSMLRDEGEPDE
ncbi:SpsF Spore coat polysaccharide biosynthesis protein F, CMP-KDO synthetase homolog [Candidatus Nanopelagicaceae bacterium]